MSEQKGHSGASQASEESALRALYVELLGCWNRRDGTAFATLFDENANVIGFDGSEMVGPREIEASLSHIFADHQTAAYIGKVREVRKLAPNVAILRTVAGMVPPGQKELNPAVNAIQTLVAVKRNMEWRITLFQNTPAQFHGRPDLAQALTEELRELL